MASICGGPVVRYRDCVCAFGTATPPESRRGHEISTAPPSFDRAHEEVERIIDEGTPFARIEDAAFLDRGV
jgi:hypothetical protein